MPPTLRSPLAVASIPGWPKEIAAFAQLVTETNGRGGTKLATALEAGRTPPLMDPLSHRRDDHLASVFWYSDEYPDREPKLLKRVKPAYLPGREH